MKRRLCWALGLLALNALCAVALAQQVTDEQRSAIRSACRNDYSNVCAGVPTGGMPALQCLQQHSQQVSAGCQQALAAVSTSTAAPAASSSAAPAAAASVPAAAAASAPASTVAARPAAPREEAHLLRTECGADFEQLCSGVGLGQGRAIACLHSHAKDLSPRCSSALATLAGK